MKLIEFAQATRTHLRVLQASRWVEKYPRPDKTVYELVLGVTWIVSEMISREKLPR